MNRFVFAAVVCGLAVIAAPASAQQQAYTAPSPAPNQFSDPAMSFTPPAGYIKANIPPHDPTQFDQPTIVAAFLGNTKETAGRMITIQMENFDGSLDGFEMVTENDLRNQTDSVFVKQKKLTTLSNGMPAYWQDITVGSGFQEAKRFEYVWIDGVRGITLSITARYGAITEDQAKATLANASGVAYPRNRY
jgi:hypothetical protein